jgi:hypothetical protein
MCKVIIKSYNICGMDKSKKSVKQINPDIELKGKYLEALKSPLYNLKSKQEVEEDIRESQSKSEE